MDRLSDAGSIPARSIRKKPLIIKSSAVFLYKRLLTYVFQFESTQFSYATLETKVKLFPYIC